MPLVMIKSDPRARLKPCLRCGYSLRNVPDARLCPECGLPIWLTLGGNDDLEMSNPEWLRRLALGAALLAVANIALVAGVAQIHLQRYLGAGRPSVAMWFTPEMTALPWIFMAYLALSAGGLFLLGGQEGRYPERARGVRRAVLAGAALAGLFAVWVLAWQLTRNTRPPTFLLATVACGAAGAGWLYLVEFARRIPSRRLKSLFKALAIALGVAVLSLVLSSPYRLVFALVMPWSRFTLPWTLFLLLYPPIAAAALVAVARTFRRASSAAQKNWETDPGASPAQ